MKKKSAKTPDPFTDSDKHVLHGIKLYPWTAARMICAQSMGLLYPEIGTDGWDQYHRTKVYPGAIKDVIICIWVCTQTEDEVDAADVAPVEAYRKAKQWAINLGIHKPGSDEFWQAYAKFSDIVREVDQAQTAPKKNADNEEEASDPNE